MQERNVARSGLRVSELGLGCNNIGWTIDDDASRAVVHKALDLGVTLFDTADYYGTPAGNSETVLGRLLGNARRDVVLISKFGIPLVGEPRFCTSRRYIMAAIEDSLRRLGTDWIDIYMLHWPDPTTPMDETLRALDDIVRSGKARYIACSNLTAWQTVQAHHLARELGTHHFIAAQSEFSLLVRDAEAELIPALEAYGTAFLPYFPLASGMLTGKYRRATGAESGSRLGRNLFEEGVNKLTDRNFDLVESYTEFAASRGHSVLELALAWLLSRPMIPAVIPGATSAAQVEQNCAALGWRLTTEDLAELDAIKARVPT